MRKELVHFPDGTRAYVALSKRIHVSATEDTRAELQSALTPVEQIRRMQGPNVIVVDVLGHRHRECGLAPAETVLAAWEATQCQT